MSIYATVCSVDDPITYYGSHVHPFEDHDDLVRLFVLDASGGNGCVLLTRDQAREIGRALMDHDPEEDQ